MATVALDVGKASELTELRNWAARRAELDPALEGAFPLFIERGGPGARWSADEVSDLTAELIVLRGVAEKHAMDVEGDAWMIGMLSACIAVATAARRSRTEVTVT